MTGWATGDGLPGLIGRMDAATAPYPAAEGHSFSRLKRYDYLAADCPILAAGERRGPHRFRTTVAKGAGMGEKRHPRALWRLFRRMGRHARPHRPKLMLARLGMMVGALNKVIRP